MEKGEVVGENFSRKVCFTELSKVGGEIICQEAGSNSQQPQGAGSLRVHWKHVKAFSKPPRLAKIGQHDFVWCQLIQ